MASRFLESCQPFLFMVSVVLPLLHTPAAAQMLLKPAEGGEVVNLLPSDMAILEAGEARKEIPCTVTDRKPELGFDMRFHSGYDVRIPLAELTGPGEILTVVFRIFPRDNQRKQSYFVQHINVPSIEENASGEAILEGQVDMGEGDYHVDWLIRDRNEHLCSSAWDLTAELPARDKSMPLFLMSDQITESNPQPFVNDVPRDNSAPAADSLTVKLLVNFAPQEANSAALQRTDTDALVSILKTIQRDPRISHVSLVAFNIGEARVVYRQEMASKIDFPALGKALQTMKLGTVNLAQLEQKHSETDFLENLITTEVGTANQPDAVIFAGPKAMLTADVPQDSLRRIGNVECPVFYMNYALDPQAIPWKDSISHAIRNFKGVEYTISRPRDLWISTTEMLARIARHKHETITTVSGASGGAAH